MKILLTCTLFVLFNFQFCLAQETPESIVSTFFYSIGEGNYNQAVESLISESPNLKNDSTHMNQLTNVLKAAHTKNGVYCGYELIEKEQVSESFINYSYFIKFMNNPVRIEFSFYKPREKWQVNSVQLGMPKNRDQEGKNQGNRGQGNKNMNGGNVTGHPKQTQKLK
jgi:hypothetical protein